MTGPPASRPATEATIRVVEKQGRASEATRRVRIVNEDDVLIERCEPHRLDKYLRAPNAVAIRKHNGQIVAIKLQSAGNDRGHLGENHGTSNVTIRQEPLESGPLLQHKNRVCAEWPRTPDQTVTRRKL